MNCFVLLMYVVAFFCSLGFSIAWYGIPEVNEYYYDGVITDMWVEQRTSFGSYDSYVFELDNNRTKTVDGFDYHNYNINDTFYWNLTRVEFNSIWD